MADRNKESRRKKRRAPAPPQPSAVVKDPGVLADKETKGIDSAKDILEESSIKVEDTSREVPPDLNGGMGQRAREHPEEVTPFAGDSDNDTDMSNTTGEKSIVCGDIAETDTLNAEKKEDNERQEKKTPANYPKGLSPFSDESDTDAVDTPINPLLPNSSEVGKPTPQPPPRRKRRTRKPKKDGGFSGCTEHKSAKDVGIYHKSAEGRVVSKDLLASNDDIEARKGNTKSGKSEDSQSDQQATIGRAGICKSAECYPEHLNPFGEDSDTEDEVHSATETTKSTAAVKSVDDSGYLEHPNPFGEDSDSDHEEHRVGETDEQSVTKDAVTATKKGRGTKVEDYPGELNPFSEDTAEEMISPCVIRDEENSTLRLNQSTASSDQEAAKEKKKLGRVKRAVKSLRRLIGRCAACARPQAESEM